MDAYYWLDLLSDQDETEPEPDIDEEQFGLDSANGMFLEDREFDRMTNKPEISREY